MRNFLLIPFSIALIVSTSYGQKLQLKKSKQPIFKSGEWVMDISEIKIYDDDLLFGRITFNENKSALNTMELKITHDHNSHMSLHNFYSVMDDNNTISEVGDGLIDFYSTKFKF